MHTDVKTEKCHIPQQINVQIHCVWSLFALNAIYISDTMVEARGHLCIMDFAFLGDHNLGTWSGTLDHVLYIFVVETELLQ